MRSILPHACSTILSIIGTTLLVDANHQVGVGKPIFAYNPSQSDQSDQQHRRENKNSHDLCIPCSDPRPYFTFMEEPG